MTSHQPTPSFFVYVLLNEAGRFYVGQTNDPEYRLAQHNSGEVRWTRGRGPWTRVHLEGFATRAEAVRRERQLKGGRASQELKRILLSRMGEETLNGGASPSGKD